jgi:hypothetical protein
VFRPVSIEKLRKQIEKYGVPVFFLMLLAFAVSFVSQGGNCARIPQRGGVAVTGNPVATIDDYSATDSEIKAGVDDRSAQSTSAPSPLSTASDYVSVTANVMDHLFKLALASEKGVKMDDNAVQDAIPSLWQQQIETFKSILTSEGKLKPTSTEKEFEDAFQKETQYSQGMTIDQAKQYFTDEFNRAFSMPSRRELIRSEIAWTQLMQKYRAAVNLTDDQVKNSFNDYSVQQIVFVGKTGAEGQQLAEKAEADIKGGMKFEDAIKKYSTDKPAVGKNLTDPQPIQSSYLQYFPNDRPLLDLKTGEVSSPIDDGTNTKIYKVIKITPDPTNSYATKKADVRKQMLDSSAQDAMQKDLTALEKSDKLVWKSDAFKAIYDFTKVNQSSPGQMKEDTKKVEDEARAAIKSDSGHSDVATYALLIANTSIWNSATPAEQKSLTADRIATFEQVLQTMQDGQMEVDLSDLYLRAGRMDDAIKMLKQASTNVQGTTREALSVYESILSRVDKLQAQGKLKDADAKAIRDSLATWRDQMAQQQQYMIDAAKERAKQEAENQRILAQQAAAQKAKDAAAAAAAKKSGTKPATTGTTAGRGGQPFSDLSQKPATTGTAGTATATTGK